jgi:CRP-like cAMP-binding protein
MNCDGRSLFGITGHFSPDQLSQPPGTVPADVADLMEEKDVFETEPRLASLTAVEPTGIFRLDQAPFYDLMAERPEVATGIIRVLTGPLHNRVPAISTTQCAHQETEEQTTGWV